MKRVAFLISLIFCLSSTAALAGQSTQAAACSGESVSKASQASVHSIAASGQVVSAAVAVPMIIVGQSAKVSAQIGEALWEAAKARNGEPFEIAEETVTAGPPPDEAVNTHNPLSQ